MRITQPFGTLVKSSAISEVVDHGITKLEWAAVIIAAGMMGDSTVKPTTQEHYEGVRDQSMKLARMILEAAEKKTEEP